MGVSGVLRRSIRLLAGLTVFGLSVSSASAYANRHYFLTVRSAVDFGAWSGYFTQQGLNTGVDHRTSLSPGFQAQFGFIFGGFIFADYNISIFETLGDAANRARYNSYIGGNLGISVPVLPLEVYVGTELGSYSFAATTTAFGSTAVRLGAKFHFYNESGAVIGACLEYRRLFIGTDQAGDLPAAYITRADVYFAGLTFGWSPAHKPAKP